MTSKLISSLFLVLCIASCKPEQPLERTRAVGPIGKEAMVASANPFATKIGVEVLREGGNAFDAAVAIQFALAVTYQHAGNIGGGGFAVFRLADGTTGTLDFREKAPLKATRDMYLDAAGKVIPQRSTLGHKAVGVPGSVAGMWALHQKYGQRKWADLLQPSIMLAHEGYALTKYGADVLNRNKEALVKANRYTPWVVKETDWQAGDWVKQPELAGTLSIIRDQGKDGFYKGIVADQLLKEMIRGGGLITQEDLDTYEPVWRDALLSTYKGYTIIGMPPPSSGGVALAQLLYGAEQYNLSALEHNSPEYIHLMAELEKRVFADRSEHLGDPDFYSVPLDTLLSPSYLSRRFADVNTRKITPSSAIAPGKISVIESDETTHFSIVDAEGNAVAITTTLNGSMGSKVMVKGAGFLLNNEMDDFSAKPGVPNMFGMIGSDGNAIAPAKRMLSSMTPTIVLQGDQVKMVIGTPGGSTIITSVFQCIMNALDHNMTMQEAVNAGRVHHQWLPDSLRIEKNRVLPSTIAKLEKMGYAIKLVEAMGRMDGILVGDSTLEGGSDYLRGDNYSEGY